MGGGVGIFWPRLFWLPACTRGKGWESLLWPGLFWFPARLLGGGEWGGVCVGLFWAVVPLLVKVSRIPGLGILRVADQSART